MDFMDDAAPERLKEALGGPADLVLSDMAANTVGHSADRPFAHHGAGRGGSGVRGEILRPGGAFVAKVLAGGADSQLVAELKRHFATVKHAKPPASRKEFERMVCRSRKGSRASGRRRAKVHKSSKVASARDAGRSGIVDRRQASRIPAQGMRIAGQLLTLWLAELND